MSWVGLENRQNAFINFPPQIAFININDTSQVFECMHLWFVFLLYENRRVQNGIFWLTITFPGRLAWDGVVYWSRQNRTAIGTLWVRHLSLMNNLNNLYLYPKWYSRLQNQRFLKIKNCSVHLLWSTYLTMFTMSAMPDYIWWMCFWRVSAPRSLFIT